MRPSFVVFVLSTLAGCTLSVHGAQGGAAGAQGGAAEDPDAAPGGDVSSGGGDPGAADGGAIEPTPLTSCGRLAGARYCEPFEDPALPAMWRAETSGAVAVDATLPYRGAAAMRAWVDEAIDPGNDGPARAHAGRRAFDDVVAGMLYARAYLKVSSGDAEMTFLSIAEDAETYGQVAAGIHRDGTLRIDITTATRTVSSGFVLPRDRWLCLGLEVEVATLGAASVTVDGVVRVSATQIDTRPDSGFANIVAGVVWAPSAATPAEVQVDELVADVAPIPCD